MLFKGRDGVLVRDRCILLCEQATQSMLKPHLPDSNEMKFSQQNITSACDFPNLSDRNTNAAVDFPSPVDSIQGRTIHRSAPAFSVNNHCQTEHMELNNNNCGCGCGILVAEFEGIKLDLVILQKKFEIEFATERTNVSQLKRELAHEKDKNSRLESDLTLFVRERNAEVDELNETIALLNDRIKTNEAIIDQLRSSNASINLEETCTFDSAQSTIVINDSGNNAKELSEYGHFNKNASTLTETTNDILGGSVEALPETTNDIIGGSAEAGEKDKNAQYNDQLLDDSHTPLNYISLDKDLNRNADNIMIMSILGIKDVSFEAGIK